tara:strand:+ start:101362 stop:102330 length:969 start_codon:yes stop_codon:yes gene_type:complete
MQYKRLGNANVNVSAFSLGSWNTFEFMPEDEALSVMKTAIDAGINFLDDARYDDTSGKAPMKTGYSEVVFGNLLRKGGFERDKLFISNRLWFEFYPEQNAEQEVDASLERIGIEYFDLVFCFDIPKHLSAEQVVDELAALVASGKVKYWAPGNWPIEFLAECCAIASRKGLPLPPAAMVPYSLAMKQAFVENDQMAALCQEYDIALVASFSLFGGLLSGKYNDPTIASRRFKPEQLEKMRASGLFDKIANFLELADKTGYSPVQLAYAYCLRHPQVATVLFGATSAQQLVENLGALQVAEKLSEANMQELAALFPQDVSLGA